MWFKGIVRTEIIYDSHHLKKSVNYDLQLSFILIFRKKYRDWREIINPPNYSPFSSFLFSSYIARFSNAPLSSFVFLWVGLQTTQRFSLFISFLKEEEEGIEEWRKLLSFSFSLSSSFLGRLEKGKFDYWKKLYFGI